MERVAGLSILLVAVVLRLGVAADYSGSYQYALNFGSELSELEKQIPVNNGLAWGFYATSCPTMESIIAADVAAFLKNDAGVAAGLLRLFFHDCFVQGCDASILLKLPSGSELNAVPNQTIRTIALQLVDDVKAKLEAACKGIVSCADIVVVAAKQAVQQSGGPSFNVPLGRRDALQFSNATGDLPSPFTTFAQQSADFSAKGLDTTDLVALAGAHTLGIAHCGAFSSRLYPTVDPKMNSGYANYLKTNVCPSATATGSSGLDFYTPNTFDNQYFKNLPTGGALMASDQNLDQDSSAWSLVNQWASNQTAFFSQFPASFVKMSQIQPLTGTSGEIRKLCSTTNSGKIGAEPVTTETVTLSQTVETIDDPKVIAMVVDGRADS